MTCQECELKLGMDEDVSEHLAKCRECRMLAREIRLNAFALRDLRARPQRNWAWATIAAAILAVIIYKVGWTVPPKPHEIRVVAATPQAPMLPVEQAHPTPPPARVAHRRHPVKQAVQPLQVKMLTSDPDVVIYWIVNRKEGSE